MPSICKFLIAASAFVRSLHATNNFPRNKQFIKGNTNDTLLQYNDLAYICLTHQTSDTSL